MDVAERYEEIRDLAGDVRQLRDSMIAAETTHRARLERVHPRHLRSATNLIHYLELRRHDIRRLQDRLAEFGLSSLGRSEPHVLATVEAVLEILESLSGESRTLQDRAPVGFGEGRFLLASRADDLLGAQAPRRAARIMVTMPSEAAHEPELVKAFVDAGMDLARINCAHDSPDDWLAMIANLRSDDDVVSPLIAMDLAGPKLRTGSSSPGPAVVRARPQRDPYGRVIAPATILLTGPPATDSREAPEVDAESALPPAGLSICTSMMMDGFGGDTRATSSR